MQEMYLTEGRIQIVAVLATISLLFSQLLHLLSGSLAPLGADLLIDGEIRFDLLLGEVAEVPLGLIALVVGTGTDHRAGGELSELDGGALRPAGWRKYDGDVLPVFVSDHALLG
jgi:hypothetical protein